LFEQVVSEVRTRLTTAFRSEGIVCRVEGRAKQSHSLLLKALTKQKRYDDIRDKAATRVVLSYPDDRPLAARAIGQLFPNANVEDFRAPPDPKTFDYSGLHFDAEVDHAGRSWPCEIQLHTLGESLWAGLAHDLVYKDDSAPYAHKRDAHRLRALTELFDIEAERLRTGLRGQHMAEERELLRALLRHYLPLTAHTGRTDLSLELLASLKKKLRPEDARRFENLLGSFVAEKSDKITHIYSQLEERTDPFLFQPESLLMFFLLERDSTSLADVWPADFPRQTPIDFATLWGVPAHDPDALD